MPVFDEVEFNFQHYVKVRNKRRDIENNPCQYSFKLNRHLGEDGHVPKHQLQGRYMQNDGKRYVIQSVHHHWHYGFYEVLLLRDINNSHTMCFYRNINSSSPQLLEIVSRHKQLFKLLPKSIRSF